MSRHVKGALFVDYVRMMRVCKDVNWSTHLAPEDLPYLNAKVDPGEWYPMATFERMGLAILAVIAGGELDRVREWGRSSIDWLNETQPQLVARGDARESLMRFQVLRRSLFDFGALEVTELSDHSARVMVNYRMGDVAEEAASLQTLGFFERLLELTGAGDVQAWFTGKAWAMSPVTCIELRWRK